MIRYRAIGLVKTFAATHSLNKDKRSVGLLLIATETCVWWDEAAAGCYGCCVSSTRLSSDCRHSTASKAAYTKTPGREQRGDMNREKDIPAAAMVMTCGGGGQKVKCPQPVPNASAQSAKAPSFWEMPV